MKLIDVIFAAILMNIASPQASAGATCESLTSLTLRDTTITVAQIVAAGTLKLPTALPGAGPHGGITFVAEKDLPEVSPGRWSCEALQRLRIKLAAPP